MVGRYGSKQKAGLHFMQSGKIARSGEEKPAMCRHQCVREDPRKSFTKTDLWRKKSAKHGSHANAALHNFNKSPICSDVEDQQGQPSHGVLH